jgi:hypothetical protein
VAAGPGQQRWPVVLLLVVIAASLAVGLSDWLGIPEVNDYTTPWHVTITFWALASVLPTLGFERLRPRHPILALASSCVGLLLFVVLVGATLRMSVHGVIGSAAFLYAAPLPIGGILLGWALASGRRRYALYMAAWFAVAATVALRIYLFEMSTPMYRVERLSGVPTSSPEYASSLALVSAAVQAQLVTSIVYFAVALALLALPLGLSGLSARRRSRHLDLTIRGGTASTQDFGRWPLANPRS